MTTFDLLIIFNLFVLESLLSVDNAAVLAIMVKDLPLNQKVKALRYGILGAYTLRGACLFLASWLVKLMWLKIVGGLYLLYLTYEHFSDKNEAIEETKDKSGSKVFKVASKLGLNRLWATIVLVEIMDLAFSIDNVFAAVALTSKFILIMTGVAIGILAMRFVAGWFVKLIERFSSLETSAFVVIGLLGVKLIISGLIAYIGFLEPIKQVMDSQWFDLAFSGIMMLIFFIPLLTKWLFTKQEECEYCGGTGKAQESCCGRPLNDYGICSDCGEHCDVDGANCEYCGGEGNIILKRY